MRTVLKLLAVVGLAVPMQAAIAFVGSTTNNRCEGAAISTCTTAALTYTAGNSIVVMYAMTTVTATGVAPTDSAGDTFTLLNGCAQNNGTSVRVECWTTASSAGMSGGTITCNLSASSAEFQCVSGAYSGVSLIGTVAVGTGSTSNPAAPSLSMQDANDWCVAGFAVNADDAMTVNVGTNRGGQGQTGLGVRLGDYNGASTIGATCQPSYTSSGTVWAMFNVELRTASTPAKSALPADTVLAYDAGAGVRLVPRSTVDAPALVDAASGLSAHLAKPFEQIATTDLPSRAGAHFGAAAELNSVFDAGGVNSGRVRGSGEVVVGYDASSRLAQLSRQSADGRELYDFRTAQSAHLGMASESIDGLDAGTGRAAHFISTLESLPNWQSAAGILIRLRSAFENLAAADQSTRQANLSRSPVETLPAFDLEKLLHTPWNPYIAPNHAGVYIWNARSGTYQMSTVVSF